MIVKAIENDDDVVYHDETMHTSPYGKYSYETYPNYGYNFIHPEFEYKQAMRGAPSIYHAPFMFFKVQFLTLLLRFLTASSEANAVLEVY